MFESWPHHVKWYILACLVSENHPKHGQKSSSRMTWASWAALGSRIKVALDLVWPILHLLSCQKFLAQKKVRLFATCDVLTMPLRFALFASVMCAALAVRPSLLGKWICFLVIKQELTYQESVYFFPRVLFSNVCLFAVPLMTATRIEDHKNAQVKADVHEHIHSEPVEKSCCATWTAKTVDSPKHCWVKGSCFKWGQSSTARDYSAVDNEMCEGKDMCA